MDETYSKIDTSISTLIMTRVSKCIDPQYYRKQWMIIITSNGPVPGADRGRMAWRPFGPLRAQPEECSDVSLGNKQRRPIWVRASVL